MANIGPWHGKRVLVTGGAGFLGSYVVETLRVRERGRHYSKRVGEQYV